MDNGKLCNTCGKFKPFEEFHKDKTQKDGFKKACKPCRSQIQKNYRTIKVTGNTPEHDRLLSEARGRALKRLVELHYPEFSNLVSRYKRELGIDPTWRNLG